MQGAHAVELAQVQPRLLGQVGAHILVFYLLYFFLPPFKDNKLPFWVPDVVCQHSEVVLWNLSALSPPLLPTQSGYQDLNYSDHTSQTIRNESSFYQVDTTSSIPPLRKGSGPLQESA